MFTKEIESSTWVYPRHMRMVQKCPACFRRCIALPDFLGARLSSTFMWGRLFVPRHLLSLKGYRDLHILEHLPTLNYLMIFFIWLSSSYLIIISICFTYPWNPYLISWVVGGPVRMVSGSKCLATNLTTWILFLEPTPTNLPLTWPL